MLLSGRTIRPTTNSARCRTRRTKLKAHLLADGEKGYLDLESDLAKAKALRDSLDVERRVLDSEVESLKQRMRQRGPAAGVINDMIHGYLGHKELEIAASEDGYHFRRNGKPMEGSLSDGEKTAIALCYFLARVAAEGRKLKDLIVPWCPSSKWDRRPPQSNPLTFAPLPPPSPGNSTMRLRSFHLRSVSPPLAYHCDESDSRPPMRQFPVPCAPNSRGSCR